jgi:integrase-like protein
VRRKSAGLVAYRVSPAYMSVVRTRSRSVGAAPGQRRSNGMGTLLIQTCADGQEVWYGRWHAGGRRLNRRIGPKRRRSTGRGLTHTEAEAELRRMMARERSPAPDASVPFTVAAEHMLRHLETLDRKQTTLTNYHSILRAQLIPSLGDVAMHRITTQRVEALATRMLQEGKAVRTRVSALKLLSQVISFAQRKGWCNSNPCQEAGKPKVRQSADIRFLDRREFEALLAAVDVSEEPFGLTDRAIFLTATMTGMRQGELLALRWRDVDWQAKGSACVAAMYAATGTRRSHAVANVQCRSRLVSPAS